MLTRSSFTAAMLASIAILTFTPAKSQAQSAGSVLGGVLGGVIAGAIIANAQARPAVVHGRRHYARPAPRARVARVRAPARQQAAPQGASVISASADPFSRTKGPSATTAVSNRP